MLYKYVGAQSGEESLKLLQSFCERYMLKASEPSTLNDPFELKIAINFEADEETMRDRFFQDRKDTSEEAYKNWRHHHTEQSQWWIKQETRKELLSRFGVICVAAAEDNFLMWSHYGKNHTGFCVGFDESQLTGINGLLSSDFVKYSEKVPLFRFYLDPPDLFGRLVFGSKSKCRAYEHEYRFVFDHSGLVKFPRSALKEIILGCRAHYQLRTYAHANCDRDEVRFFQMCEDFQEYRLDKQIVVRDTWPMSSFF